MKAQQVEPTVGPEVIAERYNVGMTTIYKLARAGAIPCYRVGGQLRFDLGEVAEALKARQPE